MSDDAEEQEAKKVKALFEEMKSLNWADADVNGYAAVDTDRVYPDLYRFAMTDKSYEGLKQALEETVANIFGDLELSELTYSKASVFDHADPGEILYREIKGDEFLGDFLSEILRQVDKLDLAIIDPTDKEQKLRFYILKASPQGEGESVYIFKGASKLITFQESKYTFLWKDKTLVRYTDPLISIQPKADCIVYRGHLFIINENGYKQIFNVLALMRQVSRGPLQSIAAKLPMENFAEFSEWVKEKPKRMQDVCRAVEGKRFQSLTFDKVLELKDEFNYDIPLSKDKKSIKFKKRGVGSDIIRLVSEAHATDKVTEENFTASRTRPARKKKKRVKKPQPD